MPLPSRIEQARLANGFRPRAGVEATGDNSGGLFLRRPLPNRVREASERRGFGGDYGNHYDGEDDGSKEGTQGQSRMRNRVQEARERRGYVKKDHDHDDENRGGDNDKKAAQKQPGFFKAAFIAGSLAAVEGTSRMLAESKIAKKIPVLPTLAQRVAALISDSGKVTELPQVLEDLGRIAKTGEQIYQEQAERLANSIPQSTKPNPRPENLSPKQRLLLSFPPTEEEKALALSLAGLDHGTQLEFAYSTERERNEAIIGYLADTTAARLAPAYQRVVNNYNVQLKGTTSFIMAYLTQEKWRAIKWKLDIGAGTLHIINPAGSINDTTIYLPELAGDDPDIHMFVDRARYEDKLNQSLLFRVLGRTVASRAGKVFFVSKSEIGDIDPRQAIEDIRSGDIKPQTFIVVANPNEVAGGLKRIADLRASGEEPWEKVGERTVQSPIRASVVLNLANPDYYKTQEQRRSAKAEKARQEELKGCHQQLRDLRDEFLGIQSRAQAKKTSPGDEARARHQVEELIRLRARINELNKPKS